MEHGNDEPRIYYNRPYGGTCLVLWLWSCEQQSGSHTLSRTDPSTCAESPS
jgi:hypothetical protein